MKGVAIKNDGANISPTDAVAVIGFRVAHVRPGKQNPKANPTLKWRNK
jgi:hypothetical protein